MIEDSRTKNIRIVKNTMLLYGRMFIMLVISLFTVRIVFNTLGVEDYGIYGLVGGIIVFFSFLNSGLASSTNRFITASIAIGDVQKGKETFNICIQAHLIIATIILVLAETIGLWVVNRVLNIPEGREFAVNIVYQFSVITTILGIVQSPFGAVITAYERFNIYAYFTIFDVIFKLAVIYLVQIVEGDKLIIYSFLIFIVGIINMVIYRIYTYRNFRICHLGLYRNVPLLKSVFKFMSWSLMGQAAVVGTNQGASVLINIYYNVVVNAAMGVSSTITTTVNNFVSNFQAAFQPQITKSYTTHDYQFLEKLMIRASKLSGFLIIIFLIPIAFEIENVLYVWLGKDYPELAPAFCRWTLVCLFFEAISAPLWMVIYAQTNIKRYQIVVSSVYSLNFWGGWVAFELGAPAYGIIVVRSVIFFLLMFIRLYFSKRIFPGFNVKKWLEDVLWRNAVIVAISVIFTYWVSLNVELQRLYHVCCITICSLIMTGFLFFTIGLSKQERQMAKRIVYSKLRIMG